MSLYSIPFYNNLLKKELFKQKDKPKYANYSHVLVYGSVSVHSLGEKGCIASNQTIANEVGMAPQTVANCLTDLNKAGWIEVVMSEKGTREQITPKLTIGLLNVPKGYSVEEPPYLVEEGTLLPEVTPLTSRSNIDNILDKSLDNSRDTNNWQAVVLYFYSKVSPSSPPSSRFRTTTKPAAKHLLSLHSEETIRRKIDALADNPREKKFISRFEKFCEKFDTLASKNVSTSTTFMAAKSQNTNPNELPPDF